MNIEDDQEELNHQPEQLSKELMDTNGTQEHSLNGADSLRRVTEDHQKGACQPKQHSRELLDIKETKERSKVSAIYSLLQEKERKQGTYRFGPSVALQQVRDFLPAFRESNLRLEKDIESQPDNKGKFNIEEISGAEGSIIEMVCQLICFLLISQFFIQWGKKSWQVFPNSCET